MVCVEDGCRRENLDLMAYLLALLLLRYAGDVVQVSQVMDKCR